MTSAHPGPTALTVLDDTECRRLLATRSVGRLGVIAEHHPLILPMNYALDEGVIVVRSGPGLKWRAAGHANVTFQADDIDEDRHTGWTVLVRGLAEEVTAAHHPRLVARTHDTGLVPWVPGEDFRWLRIIPHGISGRRLAPAPGDEWAWGIGALM